MVHEFEIHEAEWLFKKTSKPICSSESLGSSNVLLGIVVNPFLFEALPLRLVDIVKPRDPLLRIIAPGELAGTVAQNNSCFSDAEVLTPHTRFD